MTNLTVILLFSPSVGGAGYCHQAQRQDRHWTGGHDKTRYHPVGCADPGLPHYILLPTRAPGPGD